MTNGKLTLLDMKMNWYLEGELQFGVFRGKVKQLKYIGALTCIEVLLTALPILLIITI